MPERKTNAVAHPRGPSALRDKARALMGGGLANLLKGNREAVIPDTQFCAAMPPAFPWTPCTWGDVIEVGRSIGVSISRDLNAHTVTLRRTCTKS